MHGVSLKEKISRVIFFFPIQLVWVQLKKNQIILIFWAILFGYITRNLAYKYGIPHLFLYPEYLGEVDFLSHVLLGLCCGVFIMAYNISSYIINGYRFPFIATLSRPFLKFCYNNSIIPWIFILFYVWNMWDYQTNVELESNSRAITHIIGFIAGNALFIALSTLYFLATNKNIFKFRIGIPQGDPDKKSTIRDFIHRPGRWDKLLDRNSRWKIETYLSQPYKVSLARPSEHYRRETLEKVFSQNHLNASLFEVACLLAIITIGFFRDYEVFIIPASASFLLFFAIILMISSAIHSWIRGWALTVFISIFLFLHFATIKDWISIQNQAYGINYEGNKANYHEEFLSEMARDKFIRQEDFDHGIQLLENWKKKVQTSDNVKPKLLIINTSGGGLRSLMWTTLSMLKINEELDDQLKTQTHLITGSSGGMIGAAYVRELFLNDQYPVNFTEDLNQFSLLISRDILNPVTLNLVTSDLFINYQKFEDNGHMYSKDRAFAFEKTLNENMGGALNKRLFDYSELEFKSEIPMMIFAPTIINDGRRLIISAQPVSYMSNNLPMQNVSSTPLLENIEFTRFFNDQDAMSIRFSSILRMNATFPYILPAVTLPSKPEIKVMDAGIRDNYGLTSSLKYLYTFREWISENTSGVVILQLRDKFKRYDTKTRNQNSLIKNLTSPLDNFYSNWTNIQTFEQDQLIQYASEWFEGEIDIVPFQLKNDPKQRISLSWHLTNSEKKLITQSLDIQENKDAIRQLKSLLKQEELLSNSAIPE